MYEKKIPLLVTGLLTSIVSLASCYWLSVNVFFDEVYYQKSVRFGYWNGRDLSLFGDRSRDVVNLFNYNNQKAQATLESRDGNVYTIVFIGDSVTWGQGVLNSETFPHLVERNLSKYRKVKVITLALPGDNIIDHLEKYLAIKKQINPDLFIFVPCMNDIFVPHQGVSSVYESLNQMEIGTIKKDCIDQFSQEFTSDVINNDWGQYLNKMKEAWSNTSNICVMQRALNIISKDKEKTVFLFIDDPNNGSYISLVKQAGFSIIHDIEGEEIPTYAKYWNRGNSSFSVSAREGHPNRIAHQMYTDILLMHLLGEKKWKFLEE